MTASSDYFDDDDALSRSPGLQPLVVKAKPSPSPPPFIPREIPKAPEDVSTNSSKRRKRANRPKARASQGDAVLINFLANNNHPDIARTAAEEPLNSASQSEADESEEDMEAPFLELVNPRPGTGSDLLAHKPAAGGDLVNLARAARRQQNMQLGIPPSNAPESRKDSAVSTSSPEDDRKGSVEGSRTKLSTLRVTSPPEIQRSRFPSMDENVRSGNEGSGGVTERRQPSRSEFPEGYAQTDSINDSPRLRKHAISPSDVSPRQTLPAMHDPSSPPNPLGSPNAGRTLPSFHQISELADAGNQEIEARNNTMSHQHRPSTSISSASTHSAIAQSPSQLSRNFALSTQRRSPPFGPPLNSHISPPTSANSIGEPSPADSSFRVREVTSRSPGSTNYAMNSSQYFFNRPQSSAAEAGGGTYTSSVPSTGTGDSHPSIGTGDGYSSGPSPAEQHRMSIDGNPRANIILPPPNPHPASREGPPPAGGYRCDHPGCTAPPFQTQYLLK